MKNKLLISLIVLLSGCTIIQKVDPVEVSKMDQICVVEDIAVRPSFLIELKKILDEKYVEYKVVTPEEAKECGIKLVYTARWSWDFGLYMSYAKISIYKNGYLEGTAEYDSTGGGGRIIDKFVIASVKLRELIDELIVIKRVQLFFNRVSYQNIF